MVLSCNMVLCIWDKSGQIILPHYRGGGSNARLGGRELTLLCGFNQYTPLQNRDNSGLLGTPVYYSLKLGGGGGGGAAAPPPPPPVSQIL